MFNIIYDTTSSSSSDIEEVLEPSYYDLEMEKIDEDWTIYEQIVQCPPAGWTEFFQQNIKTIKRISDILQRKKMQPYYPHNNEMFTAFRLCPLANVKVIIMGQDPYPSEVNAVGMSFSGRRGVKAIPKSLSFVMKEVMSNYPDIKPPKDGWLGHWAEQGVLLLNTFLTYHPERKLDITEKKFWEPFVDAVIAEVIKVNPKVIVLLWGNEAQKLGSKQNRNEIIPGKFGKHAIEFKAGHPSPLNTSNPFAGCKHFKLVNKQLLKDKKGEIDWSFV